MRDGTAPAAAPVSEYEQVQAAWNQLNLVLGFFPRIDGRLSAVLALNLGMLGLVGGRWPVGDAVTIRTALLAVAFVVPLCVSCYQLWVAIVPDRRGGTDSLVFFRSIASMQESEFRGRFMKLSHTELACDLLEQAWRNARVLECKFNSLRCACLGMAVAVPAWVWLLMDLPS